MLDAIIPYPLFDGRDIPDIQTLSRSLKDSPIDYSACVNYLARYQPKLLYEDAIGASLMGALFEVHLSLVLEKMGRHSIDVHGQIHGPYTFHYGDLGESILVKRNGVRFLECDAVLDYCGKLVFIEAKIADVSGKFLNLHRLCLMKDVFTSIPQYRHYNVSCLLMTLKPNFQIEPLWWNEFRKIGGTIADLDCFTGRYTRQVNKVVTRKRKQDRSRRFLYK